MNKLRIQYVIVFSVLFIIEVCIALFVHDDFIRPYLGDVLVVMVIYYFIKIFITKQVRWLPLYVFLFAVIVELLQYFEIVKRLGLENYTFFRVLIGSVFDGKDILCYLIGCIVLVCIQEIMGKRKQNQT